MPRFQDYRVYRDQLYSLGTDTASGDPYLSIPVANRMVTYDEYYRLTQDRFASFLAQPAEAERFAQECRLRLHDALLILPPGTDRGTAV